MAVSQTQVTVPYTAAVLLAPEKTTAYIRVVSGQPPIFIGNAAVTAANGFPVGNTELFRIDLGRGDSLYAIADPIYNSNSQVVVLTLG